MSKGPILIEIEDDERPPRPDAAPPVPDDALPEPAEGQAMQQVTGALAYRPSRLMRWFWTVSLVLITTLVSIAAWEFVTGLILRVPLLGYAVTALVGLLALLLLCIALRELSTIARLKRLDSLQTAAAEALAAQDLEAARRVVAGLKRLYVGRPDTTWGQTEITSHEADQFDADALLGLAERALLAPLDKAAITEIEAAARQVATVTALVPLALADVASALTANLRMIRRIAVIYGGRSGVMGNWRLARAVMAHLVATGAVAIGDDLLGSVAGGGLLSKLSRRFGEGVVNGALTARVGVAAMEVCRPMPFAAVDRPSVTGLVKRALTGFFGSS
ncbi:MAG: TIGR01620 family protein [Pseudomonadota bacterium]